MSMRGGSLVCFIPLRCFKLAHNGKGLAKAGIWKTNVWP